MKVNSNQIKDSAGIKAPAGKTSNLGLDLRILEKRMRREALATTQLELIQTLIDNSLGFRDVEKFVNLQTGKLKSDKLKSRFSAETNSTQVREIMLLKLSDARIEHREAKLEMERCKARFRRKYDKYSPFK